jgi:hypothetical protein
MMSCTNRKRSISLSWDAASSVTVLLQKNRQLLDFSAAGNLEQVKRLLEEGVDVDIADYDKRYTV